MDPIGRRRKEGGGGVCGMRISGWEDGDEVECVRSKVGRISGGWDGGRCGVRSRCNVGER